jgi:hypothetical protein
MLISQSKRSYGHHIVIETDVVKIWRNDGKRGGNNPTKTSTPLPTILFYPYSILLKDGVIACVNLSMRE